MVFRVEEHSDTEIIKGLFVEQIVFQFNVRLQIGIW